jgi:calmodulin
MAGNEEAATSESVFAMFDTDGDGQITASELRAVLAELGEEVGDDEAAARIREGDSDGDGRISLEEFQAMMAG